MVKPAAYLCPPNCSICSEHDSSIFDNLIGYAIKYFNDVIKLQKKYKTPDANEKVALEALVKSLDSCNK